MYQIQNIPTPKTQNLKIPNPNKNSCNPSVAYPCRNRRQHSPRSYSSLTSVLADYDFNKKYWNAGEKQRYHIRYEKYRSTVFVTKIRKPPNISQSNESAGTRQVKVCSTCPFFSFWDRDSATFWGFQTSAAIGTDFEGLRVFRHGLKFICILKFWCSVLILKS